jgi:hypothetical protein
MPVVSTAYPSRVQIKVQKGVTAEGRAIIGSFSFNCIKFDAADADVYDFAETISGLQSRAVVSISRIDSEGLTKTL